MSTSTIERLNPFIPKVIQDPYKVYERYREQDSVHWGISSNPQLPGAWYIFKYDDVMKVMEDRRFGREFVKQEVETTPVPTAYEAFLGLVSKWIVFREPPDHTRLKSLASKAFTAKIVENIRPAIFHIADNLLDKIQNRGELDLVEEYAFPLPTKVVATMLGADPEDLPLFRRWALAMQHASASRLTPPPEVYEQANQAAQAFIDYFTPLITERRTQPREDLISALVKAADEGDKLSDFEIVATCTHLLTAGHETTINLIAKGTLALLQNPDALNMLRSHPEMIPPAVEELIRYDTPIQMIIRWAYADIEVGGKLIRRGESVGLMLGSANRDPERFKNPDVLNIQREDNKHCGFGSGIHFCLGSALARAEGQIALNVLLNRLPELRLLDEKIEWANNIVFHGPNHLHVGFRKPVGM
ncbi:cytochrome P450 [Aetokthonos hydrillicola Thurmond2011]|jgi:cytochrome P450|uniref:Cytochrome P450 n=1 Tax=Aetokthonos hydrillicola Thurmond2011 TaxID=2712845 RepID=A0AAP5I7P7_9CYAN|nr:cytochrome P450 [Aetokthonos hydrillicola]MBO3458220.1 cytochrome P450 [Aetokthonos hydrillicola CCALA 1050]MBW4584439.1 cytochrome P450 [Aetokthonos hydrillicola CCALA 1050]MDR9896401.1 cytochrome P450 [Aetokthonos hydrillicola Thurmond2011]